MLEVSQEGAAWIERTRFGIVIEVQTADRAAVPALELARRNLPFIHLLISAETKAH